MKRTTIPTLLIITFLAACHGGSSKYSKTDTVAVPVVQGTDTAKVTILYKGSGKAVLFEEGYYLRPILRFPNGKSASAPGNTGLLVDGNRQPFKETPIAINPR